MEQASVLDFVEEIAGQKSAKHYPPGHLIIDRESEQEKLSTILEPFGRIFEFHDTTENPGAPPMFFSLYTGNIFQRVMHNLCSQHDSCN